MRRRVQLYIAGRQVDLADDSWILFSWTREDLSNPTTTVNSSSNQITLPGTCRNNALLGSVFRLDRRTIFGIGRSGVNFDPMRKTPFILYADDGTVLESGYCRLDSVDTRDRRHEYKVTLYGGLGSFFYHLAMKDDGAARTLLDLTWQDADGNDIENFVMTPQAAAVNDAWNYLRTGEYDMFQIWNVVNFAPMYNGTPEDFDASHAISDHDAYFNVPLERNDVDGDEAADYTYKTGLDCALLNFTNPHTEWEMCDLRWYLQRPVVSVKAFIAAVCDPRNNGGYTVTLDPAFFNDANPAYADAWWTLPLIASADRESPHFLENLLRSSRTPMDYLTGYCKHFGLLFLWDSARHTVDIVTRATFYQQEFGGTAPEEGEETVNPSSYDSAHSVYQRGVYINRGYADTTSTNYGQIDLKQGEGAETLFYYTFDFSGIPQNAVIKSVTVKAKVSISNQNANYIATRVMDVCAGTTVVGASTTVGGSAPVNTLDSGSGWTRQSLDTLAIRLHGVRASANTTTTYYFRFYGADVIVEYEIPGDSELLEVIDLSARIDRSQQITQDPVLADKRWYQFGDGGKGAFVEQYLRDYGSGYATQRVDTGYEFDAGKTVLTEGNAFREAAEVTESSMMNTAAGAMVQTVGGWSWRDYLQLPRFEQVQVELWNAAGESRTFDVQCPVTLSYYDDPANPGADWLPKVQAHGEDNKAQDGSDILVFFAGMKDAPTYGSGTVTARKRYHLSNDSIAMQDLAGGPCWDLTFQWTVLTALPSFRRVLVSGQYITDSWEWGVPRVRAVPGIVYADGTPATLYDLWWKRYLRDRYATDTRVLTCMVDLRGLPVGQALLRRFYWIDGALWTLNAIRNHPMTSWDLTECEFVKVGDKGAYTQGPGNLGSHYIVISPSASTFQAEPNGGVLTLTVRSSSAWTLAASGAGEWATFSDESGAAGTSVLELTFQPNTGESRRSATVTLTNTDGDTVTFTVSQAPGTPASISLNPSSLEISGDGTATGGADRGRSVGVTATGAWAVDTSTVPSWITFSANTVANVLSVRVAANDTGSARSAAIKVYLTSDATVYATLAVSQAASEGGTGGITLTDGNGNDNATAAAGGQTLTLYVGNTGGQSWTLAKSDSWGTLSRSSGTGDGTVTVTVPSTSSARDQILTATLEGKTQGAPFYLHQEAPAADTGRILVGRYYQNWLYNNQTYNSAEHYDGMSVYSTGEWTAQTPNSWVHPDTDSQPWSGGATSGTSLWFSIDANTGAARTGTIVATRYQNGVAVETATFYIYQEGNSTRTLDASFNKSNIDSSAQTIYLDIQATSGLSWTISNVSSGLSPDTLSGTGSARVAVSVSEASAARTLSLTVSNSTYGLSATPSVNQSAPAAADFLRVTPFGTVNVGANDTQVTFEVECSTSWTVITSATGVTISPGSGSGNRTVTVSFPVNEDSSAKSIPLEFRTTNGSNISKTATIVQAGATVLDISVTPGSLSLEGSGQTKTVSVTASGSWSASKSDSWITLSATGGNAGTGITFSIGAGRNIGTPRTGTVTFVCGNSTATVTVTQGSDATLAVSENAVTLAKEQGSSGGVTVFASGMWDLSESTIVPEWLDVIMPAHAGSVQGESLTFRAVSANTSVTERTVTVRVVLVDNPAIYEDITVVQEGAPYLYISPAQINVSEGSGSGFIAVRSNTSWEVTYMSEGVTIAQASQSGVGDQDIEYTYEANLAYQPRVLIIRFESPEGNRVQMEITQAAHVDPPVVVTPPTILVFDSNKPATLVQTRTVRANAAWNATNEGATWLQFSPTSGAANTDVVVTFTPTVSPTVQQNATWRIITVNGDNYTIAARSLPLKSVDPITR